MRIHEVISSLPQFIATVRVKFSSGTTTARTLICADGLAQARAMLGRIYGVENVLSVTCSGPIAEDKTTQVMSPGELQVKALAAQGRRLQQQAKQLKARQAVTKAQQALQKVSTVKPAVSPASTAN